MRSWHDYHLVGYAVHSQRRQISFELFWPYEGFTDVKSARIIFTGVEGYFFEHDLDGSILFAISEQELEAVLTENVDFFEKEKKWGWPLFWKGNVRDTLIELNRKGAKCYEISSSYGLSGWIIAQRVEHDKQTA